MGVVVAIKSFLNFDLLGIFATVSHHNSWLWAPNDSSVCVLMVIIYMIGEYRNTLTYRC